MASRYQLLQLLADGRFHSGDQLGVHLGVGRGAIWKTVRAVRAMGVDVFALRGKGYRLAAPMDLLDAERIREQLHPQARPLLGEFEVLPEIDSTNNHLLRLAVQRAGSGHSCFAESQSQGRGRRGRTWISPFGANIYFSVLWRFPRPPEAMQGLSLAVGVAVARALEAAGVPGVGVKWPNDIVVDHRKLGGVLMELSGEATGPCMVVTGVGINRGMPVAAGTEIDQAWTDLLTLGGTHSDRNTLAAHLLGQVLLALGKFADDGFEPFLKGWMERDATQGRQIELISENESMVGIAEGVDASGALLLSTKSGRRRVLSGEISLRTTS